MFLIKEGKVLSKRTLSVVIALALSVIINGTVIASSSNTNSQMAGIYDQKNLNASLDTREQVIKTINTLVASAQSQVKKYRASSLIEYALTFQGVPYVYGGNGPSSFDCAGFTCYVFAYFGISLPRVASDQQNVGTYVSRDGLQPGDLVFFGSPAYHVGIYVGDGQFIEAPHRGLSVRIADLNNRSDFTDGRRVLQ